MGDEPRPAPPGFIRVKESNGRIYFLTVPRPGRTTRRLSQPSHVADFLRKEAITDVSPQDRGLETLFINVLRQLMANLVPAWEKKRYGVMIGEPNEQNTCLHYLSFADDTSLIAKSRQSPIVGAPACKLN